MPVMMSNDAGTSHLEMMAFHEDQLERDIPRRRDSPFFGLSQRFFLNIKGVLPCPFLRARVRSCTSNDVQ